jgi:hypothetical protein
MTNAARDARSPQGDSPIEEKMEPNPWLARFVAASKRRIVSMTFQPDHFSRSPARDSTDADKKMRRQRKRHARALLDHEDGEWLPESAGPSAERVIRELFDNDYDVA